MRLHTYLTFSGNCEAALQFYQAVLGAKIIQLMPVKGTPIEIDMPTEMATKILHAVFEIGGQTFMASDICQQSKQGMHGFSISINTKTAEEADRLFVALSQGGQITTPLQPTFWALRFGALIDQFGTPWMLNCEKEV